jgi:hypothetical protein
MSLELATIETAETIDPQTRAALFRDAVGHLLVTGETDRLDTLPDNLTVLIDDPTGHMPPEVVTPAAVRVAMGSDRLRWYIQGKILARTVNEQPVRDVRDEDGLLIPKQKPSGRQLTLRLDNLDAIQPVYDTTGEE